MSLKEMAGLPAEPVGPQAPLVAAARVEQEIGAPIVTGEWLAMKISPAEYEARPHTPLKRMDKGTSTSPPSVDGGTTPPMSFTDASRQARRTLSQHAGG
eukprot:s1564_g20.t1